MDYKFCPLCGRQLGQRIVGDEGLVPYCRECRVPFLDLAKSCIIVTVINEEGEVALIRQGYVSKTNWVLIAGYIKRGETLEETVIREVYEESGLKAKEVKYVGSYNYQKKGLLMIGFIAFVAKKRFSKSEEVDQIAWFEMAEVQWLLKDGSIACEHFHKSRALLGVDTPNNNRS